MSDADDRDPHLLAALRHAPDRDVAPPREVSERILAAARAAVRPMPAWKRGLDWVAQPQVAGAFGTLAIATIVGVLWATREPAPSASEPVAAALPRAAAEQDAAPPAPAPQATNAAPPATESPRVAQAPKRDAAKRNEARIAPAAPEARVDALAEKKAEALAPQPAAPIASPQPAKEAGAAGGALADTAIAGRVRAVTPPPAPAAPALAPLAKARAADPIVALDAASAWATPNARRAPGEVQRQWWTAVQAATAGRWQPIEAVPSATPALTLELGGGALVRFWFDADAIVIADSQGRPWRAVVGVSAVRDWQAELARW